MAKSSSKPHDAARAARRRRSERLRAARKARWAFRFRRLRRAFLFLALATLGLIAAAIFLDGLDDGTLILALMAEGVGFCLLAVFPSAPRIRAADLGRACLPELAGSAEVWLESHRRALPAPAKDAIDMIGVQLEQLSPHLATINENGPMAYEAHRLLSEDLPQLVESYTRIPTDIRSQPDAGGATPSQHLVEGLKVISGQIETMTRTLSKNDIDALATRNRFLESKYANGQEDG